MAGYVETHLTPGEVILRRAYRSKVVAYAPAAICGVIGVLFFLVLAGGGTPGAGFAALVVLGLVAGVFVLLGYLQLQYTEFALTDRRVLAKTGIIRQHSVEILLSKVESIVVNQGIPGRMFGYGTIMAVGTGGSRDPFVGIDDPFGFRSAVQHQLQVVNGDAAAPATTQQGMGSFCTGCGLQNDHAAKYCARCGSPVGSVVPPQSAATRPTARPLTNAEEELLRLGSRANGADEAAMDTLRDYSRQHGINVEDYRTWTEVAQAVVAARRQSAR